MRLDLIQYTWAHKKAFLKVEKELLGHNTFSGLMHDADKLFLYLLPMNHETVQKIHRMFSKHHIESIRKKKKYVQTVIDWECARYTKSDKPLSAYQYLMQYQPQLQDDILPILKELKLI